MVDVGVCDACLMGNGINVYHLPRLTTHLAHNVPQSHWYPTLGAFFKDVGANLGPRTGHGPDRLWVDTFQIRVSLVFA